MILSILGTIHLTQGHVPEELNFTQFKQSYLENKHNCLSVDVSLNIIVSKTRAHKVPYHETIFYS